MSDDLDEFDSENEANDDVHSNLISAVTQLEGKHRVKASVRKEPSIEVSEFHLVKSGTGKRDGVHLADLAESLGNQSSHSRIKQKIRETMKKNSQKTLKRPLEKVEATRIDRSVRYENVRKDIGRWDAVVQSNRISDSLSFPLNHEVVTIHNTSALVKNFKPETDLEVAMEKALNKEVVTEEEPTKETSEFPMTLKELLQRRQELAQLRARQSYKELKELRHSKIKSKKYHRVLRKERMKQQLKEFEALKESNPELALKQLDDFDRNRAEERASLRHRNTGKWAKGKAIRAKHDTESRKVLAQQLAVSKELTQKVHKDESSDDEEPTAALDAGANPWVGPTEPVKSEDVAYFYEAYRKYEEDKLRKANEATAVNQGTEALEDNIATEKETDTLTKTQPAVGGGDEEVQVKALNGVTRELTVQPTNKQANAKRNSDSDVEAGNKTKRNACRQNGKNANSGSDRVNAVDVKDHDVGRRGGKRKRPVVGKVSAASGVWSVVSEDEPEAGVRKKSRSDPQLNIDTLFENIDEKFKEKLTSRMSSLKAKLHIADEKVVPVVADDEYVVDEGGSLALKRATTNADVDEPLSEGPSAAPGSQGGAASLLSLADGSSAVVRPDVDIDPRQFLRVKPKHLNTRLPDEVGAGDDALDDDQERHATITEAFADDDVVAEFAKELEQAAKGEAVKPEPKFMPGWGSWADDPTEERKRKRLKKLKKRGLNPPKPLPLKERPDKIFGVPVIYDEISKELKEHLVRDLPFPFTSVAAYEASIRAPLGRNWVTEVAHNKLTAPKLVTKLGAIIKPMDESSLIKKTKLPLPRRRNPIGGKPRGEPPNKRQKL